MHELGCGFSEDVSQAALAIVLASKGFQVIEVKALPEIDNRAIAQILNYLKAAGGGIGMLLNFGRAPQVKRFVHGDPAADLPNLLRAATPVPQRSPEASAAVEKR